MAVDLKVQNNLEKAILTSDGNMLLHAVAAGEKLTHITYAKFLDKKCFSDEMIFAVMLISARDNQLKEMADNRFCEHFNIGRRIHKLAVEALNELPQEPSCAEKKLIKAIVFHENEEIVRLIEETHAGFYGFAPELLIMLPELSEEAVLVLLQKGLSSKLKAFVWKIFLKEIKAPDLLDCFSREERIQYVTLMTKIMAETSISTEDQ